MNSLADLNGTEWHGTGELWLDPFGDEASRSPCSLQIEGNTVRYQWVHNDTPQQGVIELGPSMATFVDTFHSQQTMECRPLADAPGIFQVQGTYGAPPELWSWRIGLFYRSPLAQLVLQMTNIAPWGEETRAVRMTCQRK